MKRISRRQTLELMGLGALAATVPSLLTGCGGGGGSSSGGGSTITPSAGTVNTAEIGGSSLAVHSATAVAVPVPAHGGFNASLSTAGAQLVSVADGAKKPRGMAIHLPQDSTFVIDANSTAIALLMLTPGILETDPVAAKKVVQKLQELAGFGALRSYLQTNLITSDLPTLLAGTALPNLMQTCVTQFSASRSRETSDDGTLSADWASDGKATSSSVVLKNSGWRWVQLIRQPLDSDQKPIGSPTLVPVPSPIPTGYSAGATPVELGSIFGGTAGAPTTLTNSGIDLNIPPRQAFLKYYAVGPGFQSTTETYPLSDTDYQTALTLTAGATAVQYLLVPIFDLATSALDLRGKASVVLQLWQKYELSVQIRDLFIATNAGEVAAALIELLISLLKLVADDLLRGDPDLLKFLGVDAALATVIADYILTQVSPLLIAINGALAGFYYFTHAPISTVILPLEISNPSISKTTLTLQTSGKFASADSGSFTVFVGGVIATPTYITDNKITCTLPDKASGPQPIVVQLVSGGTTYWSNTIDLTIVTGRWDAISTAGEPSGDIGILITDQTADKVTGATLNGATFTANIAGAILSGTTPAKHGPVTWSLTATKDHLKGNASGPNSSGGGTFNFNVDFVRQSATPTSPYIGTPLYVSAGIFNSGGEYVVAVQWDRPMGGSWEFDITQVQKDQNQMDQTVVITNGNNGIDSLNQTYNPNTFTHTIGILNAAGLMKGVCKLTLPAAEWRDPYGVSPAADYTVSISVPEA